jgi:hypothetical protein
LLKAITTQEPDSRETEMNIVVEKTLVASSPLAIYPDISDKEMYLIGKVTVSWALLESQIIEITKDLASHLGYILPPDFVTNCTLEKTLREFKALVLKIEKPSSLKKRLSTILAKVNDLKVQRHALTHGLFSWSVENPQRIRARTPKKPQSHRFDADKIGKLAQSIGQLNFELLYPHGEKQFLRDKIKTGGSINRAFAILLQGERSTDESLKLPPDNRSYLSRHL